MVPSIKTYLFEYNMYLTVGYPPVLHGLGSEIWPVKLGVWVHYNGWNHSVWEDSLLV